MGITPEDAFKWTIVGIAVVILAVLIIRYLL